MTPPLRDRELDIYGSQLARCLKALGTDAPIRADIQRELATVRAEQDARAAGTSAPARRLISTHLSAIDTELTMRTAGQPGQEPRSLRA